MFVYAHKNGGPKRNSIGGIDAEFIKIDKRQDKRKLMNMLSTKKIGGFTFKFNLKFRIEFTFKSRFKIQIQNSNANSSSNSSFFENRLTNSVSNSNSNPFHE